MSITGITGFRSLRFEDAHWRSASHTDFVWDSPIVWAECPYCPKDDEGHVVISHEDGCGIHATLWDDEFRAYMNTTLSVGVLVEAIGHLQYKKDGIIYAHTWAHTCGFTSTGVLVVGVVNLTRFGQEHGLWSETNHDAFARQIDTHMWALKKAAHDFGVPILDYGQAREVTKIMWERHGLKWPKEVL